MQIFIDNSTGKIELPVENSKFDLPLYNNVLLVMLAEKELVKVESHYNEKLFNTPGAHCFPIAWDKSNKCNVTFKLEKTSLKYHFQLENAVTTPEEVIINLLKFETQVEETFRFDKVYAIQEMYDAIKADKVALIIEKTPYNGYNDQTLLEAITDTVPMVMDICSHPKQSLRTEESVLDVNLVKRINSKTMDHLASHSEHWKGRTLNGLIPNRLRADTFEDEINIYENLFFRMAVDDILKYVHRQVVSLEKAIQQNDNAIDWNAYGETLYDYKRLRIFEKLLPDYDVSQRQEENKTLLGFLNQWRKLEKIFSTVGASKFYRCLDKKKHISRNIQPTNILKKDSRYNALYRLWCEIQRQNTNIQIESKEIGGINDLNLCNYYSMYVAVLLLYAFKLLECEAEASSKFSISVSGIIEIDATFHSDNMTYIVKSSVNDYGTLDIHVSFIEKTSYDHILPAEVLSFIDEIKQKIPAKARLDLERNVITFYAKPTDAEQRELKNLFHINKAAAKGMEKKLKDTMDLADKVWRLELEDLFISGRIKDARVETIKINPQFVSVDNSEMAIDSFTRMVLDGTEDSVVYTFPIELGEYRDKIKKKNVLNRLLNYGEKYAEEEAERWGDYRIGILPIAQAEINSAQRLMKLISIHTSRLQIRWNNSHVFCPVCGGSDCTEESSKNWKCKNPDCGIIFGITKHSDGCGACYEWTRPFVDIKAKDIVAKDALELMLKKETIFDRLAITDFEFETKTDGEVKYIPVCPKCGKRSK